MGPLCPLDNYHMSKYSVFIIAVKKSKSATMTNMQAGMHYMLSKTLYSDYVIGVQYGKNADKKSRSANWQICRLTFLYAQQNIAFRLYHWSAAWPECRLFQHLIILHSFAFCALENTLALKLVYELFNFLRKSHDM